MKIQDKIDRIVREYSNKKYVIIYNVKKKDQYEKMYSKLNYDWYRVSQIPKSPKGKLNRIMTSASYNDLLEFKSEYFLLDYSKLTTNDYYIYAVNFNDFDFKKFYDESKNKDYKGAAFAKKRNLNLGDTVYLFFTHLPDGRSRIMAKGVVIDDGFHYNNSNDIMAYDCEKISVLDISIKSKYEKNMNIAVRIDVKNNVFDYYDKNLTREAGFKIDRYNFINPIDIKVVNKIEKAIANAKSKKEVKTFSWYRDNMHNVECFFKTNKEDAKKLGLSFGYNHKTFQKENNNMHYELHHIIEQYNYRKNNDYENTVYDDDNTVPLCLECHARIHHGKFEDREKMLKLIWQKTNINKVIKRIPQSELNGLKPFDWLLNQYISKK